MADKSRSKRNQALAGGSDHSRGLTEASEGEALLDYAVGQLEDADAASGAQVCVGLLHSTGVALALAAEKGKRVNHSLDGGCEMQRAHSREGQVVLCLMLDTFLLLTAAGMRHQILAFLSSHWFRMQHSSSIYLALGD